MSYTLLPMDMDSLYVEYGACDCCGVASMLQPPRDGMCCPICGWSYDTASKDEFALSIYNDGLCLMEARLNFQTFGTAIPTPWRETE